MIICAHHLNGRKKGKILINYINLASVKRVSVLRHVLLRLTKLQILLFHFGASHEYQLANPERGIGMSTNQLVEPNYYSMAYSPQWLRDQQKEQVPSF